MWRSNPCQSTGLKRLDKTRQMRPASRLRLVLLHSPEMKTGDLVRRILTDLHFWVPAAVLALGAGLLLLISRA